MITKVEKERYLLFWWKLCCTIKFFHVKKNAITVDFHENETKHSFQKWKLFNQWIFDSTNEACRPHLRRETEGFRKFVPMSYVLELSFSFKNVLRVAKRDDIFLGWTDDLYVEWSRICEYTCCRSQIYDGDPNPWVVDFIRLLLYNGALVSYNDTKATISATLSTIWN